MTKEKGLYKKIRERILEDYGDRLDGEALPSERELAERYDVKRSTVQYALRSLEAHGKVYRIRGKGTFIRKARYSVLDVNGARLKGSADISMVADTRGIKLSNYVIVSGTMTGSRFLESRLELEEGDPVYALHRVRYGNDEPIAIECTYVPEALFEDIGEHNFSMVSLYSYMESNGHLPVTYDKRLRITKLPPDEARYLDLPVDSPVFYISLKGYDKDGRVVEYTESYIRSDKTEFKFDAGV